MRENDTNIYRKKNKLCAFDSDGGQFITMQYTQAYIYNDVCFYHSYSNANIYHKYVNVYWQFI